MTKEQACSKEQALIKLFNTTDPICGFNHTPGGEHYKITEEARNKLRAASTKVVILKEDLYQYYTVQHNTLAKCAEHFECSIGTIQYNLKKYSIPKTDRHLYVTYNARPDITYDKLYYQYIILNKNFEQCALAFSCSLSYMIKLCKKYNLTKRPGHHRTDLTKELLEYEYLKLNQTQQEIALKYGCERQTISNYLKKYGILKKGKI